MRALAEGDAQLARRVSDTRVTIWNTPVPVTVVVSPQVPPGMVNVTSNLTLSAADLRQGGAAESLRRRGVWCGGVGAAGQRERGGEGEEKRRPHRDLQ